MSDLKKACWLFGKDSNGNDLYQCVDGAHRHVYCSTALKAWRTYLVKQIKPAVDAGVDLVYLDESMAAIGQSICRWDERTVDGVMTEEADIKAAYPNVAIETEQFNPMSGPGRLRARQMPLGIRSVDTSSTGL